MRVKSEYIHHKEIKGAVGVKVIGNGLEKVMAGTPVMVSVRIQDLLQYWRGLVVN
jgi:hypothetical protein